jgi:hypothetical protein
MSIGGLTDQADARARSEARTGARRRERIAIAHRAGWPELPRRHLRFERFGGVIDERSGVRYRIKPR